MTDQSDKDGWDVHSKLVISELKSIHKRLDTMETQLEDKIDKYSDMFRADHKDLENKFHAMEVKHEVELATIKTEMSVKSAMIAFVCSGVVGAVTAFIVVLMQGTL